MLSRLMTLREQLVLGGLAVAIVLGAGTMWWLGPPTQGPAMIIEQGETAAAVPTPAPAAEKPLKPPTLVTPEMAATQAPAEVVLLPDPIPVPVMAEQRLVGVSVQGAVREPGFHWMPEDARVQELLDAAGGPTEDADLSDIKLSARLIDATTLTVPRVTLREREGTLLRARGGSGTINPAPYTNSGIGLDIPPAPPPAPPAPAATPAPANAAPAPAAAAAGIVNGKVDLNHASQAELETLPGIGPAYATRIIANRPFTSVDDLDRVPGFADKRIASLRDHVVVNP